MPTTFVISVLNSFGRLGRVALYRGGVFKRRCLARVGRAASLPRDAGLLIGMPIPCGFLERSWQHISLQAAWLPFSSWRHICRNRNDGSLEPHGRSATISEWCRHSIHTGAWLVVRRRPLSQC